MLDITEIALARQALQDSEVRLSTLAAMVPEILYTAAPEGTLDYVRFAVVQLSEVVRRGGCSLLDRVFGPTRSI